MRLTAVLCYVRRGPQFPRGNMWKGKFRLVRPYGPMTRGAILNSLSEEYETMRVLAKPYLTEEQEASQPDWDRAIEDRAKYERQQLNMREFEHKTIEDHLRRLDIRKWE